MNVDLKLNEHLIGIASDEKSNENVEIEFFPLPPGQENLLSHLMN
ncbi:unknown protein [Simkania negevensis Z]|uniref:Uncharacterized protein n=1 Tax=Simkania negevensis (strain ATCC VR-1471 / DSM 27360 / Z) TaxID=331113 RepID=F8L4L7_SIMNZ|nr:unknown protein [Simkania negevensis Z]